MFIRQIKFTNHLCNQFQSIEPYTDKLPLICLLRVVGFSSLTQLIVLSSILTMTNNNY